MIFLFSFFHGLCFPSGHFFGESFASVGLDVADARRAVRVEQEGEDFPYHIVMRLAGFYVRTAFGTTVEAFRLAALSDFAPSCLVVLAASRTLTVEVFTTCSAIQATGGDVISGGGDGLRFVFHLYLLFY